MAQLEVIFPGLRTASYRVTSAATEKYNCIAWAAGDTERWWWPAQATAIFWPTGVPREQTREAFLAAFTSLGYAVCDVEGPEEGGEKIALFADADGLPTHAARQLPSGRWTSKLGRSEDIEHDLHDLEGVIYGAVLLIMKRGVGPRVSP